MTFKELAKLLEDEFGASRLADMARELEVTPQVVSNWKSRNQVPYKYVKYIREKIDRQMAKKSKEAAIPVMPYLDSGYFNKKDESLDFSVFKLLSITSRKIREKKIFFTLCILLSLLFSFYHLRFIQEPLFVCVVKILPIIDNNSPMKGLSSIANKFGMSTPSSAVEGFESAEMLPDVIKSRKLAKNLLSKKFDTELYGKEHRLIDILYGNINNEKKITKRVIEKMAIKLSKAISVIKTRKSPLLTMKVSLFEAKLSSDVADSIIIELDKIISNFRSSRILDKKTFVDSRLLDVNKQLIKAEEDLKVFRERNRNILSSPSLLLEQERLFREVQVQTQIYITLKNQYEMLQIEVAGGKKNIEVLDRPFPPFTNSNNSPFSIVVIYLILGNIFFFIYHFVIIDFIRNKKYL